MPTLDNWYSFHGYVCGEVTGHPDKRYYDGKEIRTSRIWGFKDGVLKTKTGTEYRLGQPHTLMRMVLKEKSVADVLNEWATANHGD